VPVYSYVCKSCYVISEAFRPASERDILFRCPQCKSENTSRRVSNPNVHMPIDGKFRGSGKADLDKLIGEDSEAKHDYYSREKDKKDKVRLANKTNAIGKTSAGEYVPVPESHLKDRETHLKKFDYAKKHGQRIDTP